MGKISIYERKFPNPDKPHVFVVTETANGKRYHHSTFHSRESADIYVNSAIEMHPVPKKVNYPTPEQSLKNILKSNRYSFPKRVIR